MRASLSSAYTPLSIPSREATIARSRSGDVTIRPCQARTTRSNRSRPFEPRLDTSSASVERNVVHPPQVLSRLGTRTSDRLAGGVALWLSERDAGRERPSGRRPCLQAGNAVTEYNTTQYRVDEKNHLGHHSCPATEQLFSTVSAPRLKSVGSDLQLL